MRKWLNNPWIVGLLALGALAAAVHSLMPMDPRQGWLGASAAVDTPPPDEEPSALAQSPRDALRATPLAVPQRELFLSPPPLNENSGAEAVQKDMPVSILLSAIWSQGTEAWVVINSRILSVGDSVDSFHLQAITADGAWITRGDERTFLTLGRSQTVRVPATSSRSLTSR